MTYVPYSARSSRPATATPSILRSRCS